MIEVQRLVLPYPTVRRPERLRLGPRFEHGAAFPARVRSVEGLIVGFLAFEQVKLHEARHLVEVTSSTDIIGQFLSPLRPPSNGKDQSPMVSEGS
jgi:hypothetical protein